jgi:CRISPR-associated endonuclease/helicase Cas3
VVLNTVDRATAVFEAVVKQSRNSISAVLLHSRFRPGDRDVALAQALEPGFDGVVISTQVIEAGVDVSAALLVTEIAPWPALVQRAGRCNRAGEYADATVIWLDHADGTSPKPYEPEEIEHARNHVRRLESFNPAAIEGTGVSMAKPAFPHVVRRRDVIDLFDTTPDLGGVDIDVSRFIRDGDERDVQVFWRDFDAEPVATERRPVRDELCAIPFVELRAWTRQGGRAWRWDAVDGEWVIAKQESIAPGMVFMLRAVDGGYTSTGGWSPRSKQAVAVVQPAPATPEAPEEAIDADPLSMLGGWVPLTTHAIDTREAAREILDALAIPELPSDAIVRAAQAHDLGKAHPIFQDTMRQGCAGPDVDTVWAKAGNHGARHSRRGFRHELASALAWLVNGTTEDRDLVAYLLAAHHGKVRMSLRPLPTDAAPGERERLHARGVWDGDVLPQVDLGATLVFPSTSLSLTPMLMGRHRDQPSWMERALTLRDAWGPFRLAYLEALVRAADVRASLREKAGTA